MRLFLIFCVLIGIFMQPSFGKVLEEVYDFLGSTVGVLVDQLLSQLKIAKIEMHFNPEERHSIDLLSSVLLEYDGSVMVNSFLEPEGERAAVIVDNSELLSLVQSVVEISNRVNLYIVIVDGALYQTNDLITWAFKKLWRLKVIHVRLIVVHHQETIADTLISMYDYEPYDELNCGKVTPNLLSSLKLKDFKKSDETVSLKSKLTNFNGCPLSVGIIALPPFTVSEKVNNTWHHTGLEVDLMMAVAEHLNFEIKFVQPPDGLMWGELEGDNSTGLMGIIFAEMVDFGFGCIARNLKRNTVLRAGVENFFDKVIFAVPPGIPYTAMEKLLLPFSTASWISIAVVSVVTALFLEFYVTKTFRHRLVDKIRTPLLDVWLVLMGGGVPKPPSTDTNRYVIIGWFYATLVLRTCYQAVLFSHLNAGVEYKPIYELDDIESGGIFYYMYNITQRFFVDIPRIKERTIVVRDDIILFDWFAHIADSTLMGAFPVPRSTVSYFNKNRQRQPHCHATKYLVTSYTVGTYYPRNSPLTPIIDDVVLRIHAAGLQFSWENKYKGLEDSLVSDQRPLNIEDLLGAILIHFMLCGVCCLVFFAEIVAGWMSRKKPVSASNKLF